MRLTFVISDFDQKSIYKKNDFFKGVFFVEMQAELLAFGPKNNQKIICNDQDGIIMKIFNDKR